MRIERYSVPSLEGLRSVLRADRPAPRSAPENVSLSRTGELFLAAYRRLNALPATRAGLVERLRTAIQAGRYQPNAEATAHKILAALKGAN